MKSDSPPPQAPPTTLAILMSAVYPGIGQCIQKRWVAGAIYAFICTVLVALWIVEFARIMLAYLSLMNFDAPPEPAPGFKRLLIGFALIVAVYAASLVDTIAAHTRALRHRPRPHHAE